MKKGKNKDEGEDDKKDGGLQKPEGDKLLEKKWDEFVKGTEKTQETVESRKSNKKMAGKPEKISKENGGIPPKKPKVMDFLETDVDKLYELVREKGILKVKEAAKALGIDTDLVEEWGRILEEHKLVRLRYPPIGEPILILKRFTADKEKIKNLKEGKKLRPAKKVFIINLIILLSFATFIAFYTIKFRTIRITYTQAYLVTVAIIVIGVVLVFRSIRKRVKHEKKSGKET